MGIRPQISLNYRRITSPFRSLPDFLVLGAMKAGTTFLYHCLKQHPDVGMGWRKELHFFDKEENYRKGVFWYRAMLPFRFFPRKKCIGEITPRYIFVKEVPARVKSMLPKAKLIVLLRDPVTRTFSHYNMSKRNHDISWTFEEYIQQAKNVGWIDIKKNGVPHRKELNLLTRGLYKEQIENWYKFFPKEQFLFIESEAFFKNTEATLRQIYDYLGLRPILPRNLEPQRTGDYQDQIKPETRKELEAYFRESNEWLANQGFEFSWLPPKTEP